MKKSWKVILALVLIQTSFSWFGASLRITFHHFSFIIYSLRLQMSSFSVFDNMVSSDPHIRLFTIFFSSFICTQYCLT